MNKFIEVRVGQELITINVNLIALVKPHNTTQCQILLAAQNGQSSTVLNVTESYSEITKRIKI